MRSPRRGRGRGRYHRPHGHDRRDQRAWYSESTEENRRDHSSWKYRNEERRPSPSPPLRQNDPVRRRNFDGLPHQSRGALHYDDERSAPPRRHGGYQGPRPARDGGPSRPRGHERLRWTEFQQRPDVRRDIADRRWYDNDHRAPGRTFDSGYRDGPARRGRGGRHHYERPGQEPYRYGQDARYAPSRARDLSRAPSQAPSYGDAPQLSDRAPSWSYRHSQEILHVPPPPSPPPPPPSSSPPLTLDDEPWIDNEELPLQRAGTIAQWRDRVVVEAGEEDEEGSGSMESPMSGIQGEQGRDPQGSSQPYPPVFDSVLYGSVLSPGYGELSFDSNSTRPLLKDLNTAVHLEAAAMAPREVGPHPGIIEPIESFVFQHKIDQKLVALGMPEERENHVRLLGVQWIENVSKSLKLPIKTFIAACVFYHKFRLCYKESEYSVQEAAAACLLLACKVQETFKKSREILCAAHNLRLPPGDHLTPDDPIFEPQSKSVLGVERQVLEASRFNYNVRDPSKMTMKLCLSVCNVPKETQQCAWYVCRDLHRTWAPLKQGRNTIAIASVELAVRLTDYDLACVGPDVIDYDMLCTTRAEVMETILDALDLWTLHSKQTTVGSKVDVNKFLSIRLVYNQEASEKKLPRHTTNHPEKETAEDSPKPSNGAQSRNGDSAVATPATPGTVPASPSQYPGAPAVSRVTGTLRFILDPKRARDEQSTIGAYFNDEYEEIEIEVPENEARNHEGRVDDRNDRNIPRGRR